MDERHHDRGRQFPADQHVPAGDDLVAMVELPGVNKNKLEIEAKENTLRISGRKTIRYGEGASVHRRERIWGGQTSRAPIW